MDEVITSVAVLQSTKENKDEINFSADQKSVHYNNVKKKYFDSLGMNRPSATLSLTPQSAPTGQKPLTARLHAEQKSSERSRTRTVPNFKQPNSAERQRSSTLPIPISPPVGDELLFPITISSFAGPNLLQPTPSIQSISPQDYGGHSDDDGGNSEDDSDQFIPPHELLKQGESFNVGTARSLAHIERRQRNYV